MTSGISHSQIRDSESPHISRDMHSSLNLESQSEGYNNIHSETFSSKQIDRIRTSETNIDRLKIAIYMEAANVYRGRGVERRFADYLDGLGRYLSSGSVRSNDDVATNGINNVLQIFLTTKKLRKLHNMYVKSLMSQCLQTKVSRKRTECHIPFQWRGMIKLCKTETPRKNTLVCNPETHDPLLKYVHSNFGSDSIVWKQTGIARLTASIPTQLNVKNPAKGHFKENQSTRIPGVLEIDHIANHAFENEDYCLSQSALWTISIAVKEYISKILNDITTHFDAQMDDKVSRKPRCLTCYDILQVMNAQNKNNETSDRRVAWEHLSNACLTIATGIPTDLVSEVKKINRKIVDRAHNNVLNQHDEKSPANNIKSPSDS
jgi:hypothetical protein